MKKKKDKKVSKFFQIFDYRIFGYEFVKVTGGLPIVLWYRIKKIYVNKNQKKILNHQPYLIAPNHIGFTDIMIVANTFWNRRLRFVATKDLYTNKFRHFLFNKLCACIKVDKENVSMKTFKEVKDALNRGHCVPVFPEGTIAKEANSVIEYKSGVVLMALVSKVPILPIYMEKRTKWYKRQRVVIGEFIDLTKYTTSPIPSMEEIKRLTIILHDEECKLKGYLEKSK